MNLLIWTHFSGGKSIPFQVHSTLSHDLEHRFRRTICREVCGLQSGNFCESDDTWSRSYKYDSLASTILSLLAEHYQHGSHTTNPPFK